MFKPSLDNILKVFDRAAALLEEFIELRMKEAQENFDKSQQYRKLQDEAESDCVVASEKLKHLRKLTSS